MSGGFRTAAQAVLTLDYRSLALFRFTMGLVIVFDLVSRSLDMHAFYLDDGLLPRQALIQQHWYDRYTSIYMHSGDAVTLCALFVIAGLVALAFAVGYRTKLTHFLSFLFLLSLHNRSEIILQGGDHLLRLLCFWSLFLPLGAKYSIDSRSRPSPTGHSYTSVVTLGVLLQIAFLYLFSAVQKLVDPLWLDGSAIMRALLLDDFATPLGVHLLGAELLLRITTWATLVIEAVLPLMLFSPIATGPIRLLLVLTYWALHIGIDEVLYVGFFTPVTLMAWTVVLPTCFWDWLQIRFVRLHGAGSAVTKAPAPSARLADSPAWIDARAPLLIAILLVVTIENLSHTPGHNFAWPRPVSVVLSRTGFKQNWSMFTGLDHYERGWFIIPAKLADGSEVDLFRDAQPLSWRRPERPFGWISDNRWYKYYGRVSSPHFAFMQPYLGPYLCKTWNRSHDAHKQIEVLYVARVSQAPIPSERIDPAHSRILVKHECRPGAAIANQRWVGETASRLLDGTPAT